MWSLPDCTFRFVSIKLHFGPPEKNNSYRLVRKTANINAKNILVYKIQDGKRSAEAICYYNKIFLKCDPL